MVTRSIYCKEEQLDDVKMVLDVVIPNDYYVFVNQWRVVRSPGLSGVCVDLELESQEDWSKLKKRYFPNYKKPALLGSIILEDTKKEQENKPEEILSLIFDGGGNSDCELYYRCPHCNWQYRAYGYLLPRDIMKGDIFECKNCHKKIRY